jgi:hypothetical protein
LALGHSFCASITLDFTADTSIAHLNIGGYFERLDVDSFVSALEGSFAIRVSILRPEVIRLERRGPGRPRSVRRRAARHSMIMKPKEIFSQVA